MSILHKKDRGITRKKMAVDMRLLFTFFFISLLCSETNYAQHTETGLASYYSDSLQGNLTASGETYDRLKLTAAHRNLAFHTKIKVTNLENKKTAIVIINDRGPFVKGRILDLSRAAAEKLDFIEKGVVQVKIELLKP